MEESIPRRREEAHREGGGRDPGARFELALLSVGFVVLFFFFPHHLAGDDVARFNDVELLRTRFATTKDPFSLAMPILSLPFDALGTVVKSPVWWVTRFNVVVVAVAVVANYLLLRRRVEPRLLRRFFLVLLFASFFTYELRTFNTEVADTAFIATGITLLTLGRVKSGWALLVYAAVNTPAAVAGLAVVSAAETVRARRLRFLLPVVVAAFLIGLENWLRRGSPFTTGEEGIHGYVTEEPYSGHGGFSYPFVLGVVSILFAAGRGLLFYAPGLTLWLAGRTRQLAGACSRTALLLVLFVAGLVVAYAKWWSWNGGVSWGPRYFVIAAVPASLALALRLGDPRRSAAADALTLCVLAFSTWIAFAGVLASGNDAEAILCTEHGYALESFCSYSPAFSSLWYPFLGSNRQYWPSAIHHSPSIFVAVAFILVVFVYLAAGLIPGVARAGFGWISRTVRGPGWRL
ncbi:MAG TPA: hypothetical protein VH063_11265 [Gaiellaceae bacterium]|jgi:hypothetical protein|nr:hypothetical protein [Gaiellaceae bacterium]